MECGDLRETLSVYASGEADAGEALRLEEHLAACPSCRMAVARMRAADGLLARVEGQVAGDFREKLFARLEKEELLPKRRSLFAFSIRWLVLPASAVAALALFLMTTKENGMNPPEGRQPSARLAQRVPEEPAPAAGTGGATRAPPAPGSRAAVEESKVIRSAPAAAPVGKAAQDTASSAGKGLSSEDREIVAYLELLENPAVFEDPGDVDEMELFVVPGKNRG